MSVQWNVVVGGFVFLLVGLAIAGVVGYSEYRDYQIRDEVQETTAEFLGGDVERDRQKHGDNWETVYVARSHYGYTVDGTAYEGSRYAEYRSPSRAERAIERRESESPFTVYYHPDSPEESYTSRPGVELSAVLLGGGLGGIFVVVGLRTVGEGLRGKANVR